MTEETPQSRYRAKLSSRTDIEIPESKKCGMCEETKPSSEFPRNRSRRDGLAGRCKLCMGKTIAQCMSDPERAERKRKLERRRSRTPEGRVDANKRGRRYRKSSKGKLATKRFLATPKGKALKRRKDLRYLQTERGREVRRRILQRYFQRHPERGYARYAVGVALARGVLKRPEACEGCGRNRKLEAHHHHGYEREHWLDVQWLCEPCHKEAEPLAEKRVAS